MLRRILCLACALGACALPASPGWAAVWYVKAGASSGGDGHSWATAFSSVTQGLGAAGSGDEVWAAKGTYAESGLTPNGGVSLYGGFAGTETDRSQRDWSANPTILDGGSQATHNVVNCSQANIVVDGFTIRNGADGVSVQGGSTTLSNNTIRGNGRYGVNMFGSTITLSGNVISGNASDGVDENGGATLTGNTVSGNGAEGLALRGGDATLTGNTISGNVSTGVDVFGVSTPTLSDNTITGNGFVGVAVTGRATLISNVISGNAYHGVYVTGGRATLANDTLSGNGYDGMSEVSGAASVANTIVAFNGRYGVFSQASTISSFSHNDVVGNTGGDTSGYTVPSGQGNLSVDPKFVRNFSPGPDGKYGTADDVPGDFHLQAGSPCIDAGDDSVVTAGDTDKDGHPRIAGSHVDIGAYEYGTYSIWHVSPTGDDAGNGVTWATAKKTVGAALSLAQGTDGVWVAKGTYTENITPPADVSLYGGFAGTETQRSQRNAKTNPTVLDGGGSTSQPVVACSHANIVVDGFTIRNSYDGIDVTGTAILTNNTMSGNSHDGVLVFGGTVTLANNAMSGNGRDGVFSFGTATLTNNTVYGNTSDGVYVVGAGTMTNNIVAFNGADGVDQPSSGAITAFSHNDVYGNTGGDYAGYTPPSGQGNSSLDPLFVNRTGGDLHLMSGSPGIDAGDDTAVTPGETDLDGKPRILGAHVDIGAYEYDAAHAPFTTADVQKALQTAGGLVAATGADRTRLDVNADGLVSLQDAFRIARKVAGLETNP